MLVFENLINRLSMLCVGQSIIYYWCTWGRNSCAKLLMCDTIWPPKDCS